MIYESRRRRSAAYRQYDGNRVTILESALHKTGRRIRRGQRYRARRRSGRIRLGCSEGGPIQVPLDGARRRRHTRAHGRLRDRVLRRGGCLLVGGFAAPTRLAPLTIHGVASLVRNRLTSVPVSRYNIYVQWRFGLQGTAVGTLVVLNLDRVSGKWRCRCSNCKRSPLISESALKDATVRCGCLKGKRDIQQPTKWAAPALPRRYGRRRMGGRYRNYAT